MPYYHVLNGGTFKGEREISGIIYWRPVSFVTPLEIGPRKYGFVGSRQVTIEIMSHDEAQLFVNWGNVNLLLQHHDQTEENATIFDVGAHPLSSDTKPDNVQSITVEKGVILPLFKTSVIVEKHEDEKLDWNPAMEEPFAWL